MDARIVRHMDDPFIQRGTFFKELHVLIFLGSELTEVGVKDRGREIFAKKIARSVLLQLRVLPALCVLLVDKNPSHY